MIAKPANSMQRITHLQWFGRSCALALAAAAVAFALEDLAEASCGDYVFVRDAQGRLVPAADLNAGSAMAADHSAMPSSVPCHGPRCSRSPSAPPAAPLSPIRSLSPPDALLSLAGEHAANLVRGAWPTSRAPLHPVYHPGRIFRPPRF